MSEQINHEHFRLSMPLSELSLVGLTNVPFITSYPANSATGRLPVADELRALDRATAWLNSPPLTVEELRGNVVLVDFWTYTCINWLRTLPYIRAWAERYREQGLVVIGVHAPEFPFEHDIDNVRRASKDMRVGYPVAIDNAFAIWRGFNNHYWPALYLFDADGQLRHHHFGEGDYARSERMIQQLLAESGVNGIEGELVSVDAEGIEAEADWSNLESPETYLGYERTDHFASPGGLMEGERRVYSAPVRLRLNQWAIAGDWTVQEQAVSLYTAGGRIAYRFHARDLHLVMGPAAHGASVPFRVFLDGQAPGEANGTDVDEQGNGTVTDQRLYQLVRQPQPIADRLFEIEFLDAGVEACVFTFG